MTQARKTITYQMPGAEPQTAHLFEDRVERFQGYVAREGGTVLSVAAFEPETALAGLRAALGPLLVMTESPPCQQAADPKAFDAARYRKG